MEDPITNTEPCVQRLVIGPYLETGMGPQGLKLAQGSVLLCDQHYPSNAVAMRKVTSVLFLVVLFSIGVAHAATPQFNRNLYYGLTNDSDVKALQQLLSAQGYYSGPITGNYYSLTQQAVKKFQSAQGLSTTGYFGPLSRNAINAVSATPQPSQPPKPSTVASSSNNAQDATLSSSTPPSPSNATLCNGTYWTACQAGQEFVCPTDGVSKAYCQVQLPAATASQISGIALLCSTATSQGNTAVIQLCTDGTILRGYNSNAIFRNNVDIFVQELEQKIARQQAATDNQVWLQNYLSGLNANTALNQNFLNEENSLNAENAALQQQMQNSQILQTLQQNQELLKKLATPPAPTHCAIDAGVFTCNLPGAY